MYQNNHFITKFKEPGPNSLCIQHSTKMKEGSKRGMGRKKKVQLGPMPKILRNQGLTAESTRITEKTQIYQVRDEEWGPR